MLLKITTEGIIRMERHMKVFGVDFDGTLSFGQWPGVGPANEELKYSDVIGV